MHLNTFHCSPCCSSKALWDTELESQSMKWLQFYCNEEGWILRNPGERFGEASKSPNASRNLIGTLGAPQILSESHLKALPTSRWGRQTHQEPSLSGSFLTFPLLVLAGVCQISGKMKLYRGSFFSGLRKGLGKAWVCSFHLCASSPTPNLNCNEKQQLQPAPHCA